MSKHTAEDIVRRATAAFNSGQPGEARKLCEEGLSRQPGDPMLNHLLAAVLFSKGEIQPARTHVETSLANRPGNAAAQLLAARIARAARDFGAALSHLDRAIATCTAAGSVSREGPNPRSGRSCGPQAHEAWRAILQVVPKNMEAAARLGRLAWEDGDCAAAVTYLECAAASDAPASVWFDLGLVRQDLRSYESAATAYRKALEIKPDHAEAALNLGVVLQEAGDLDSAMRAYAEAYRLRPQTFGTIAMALTSAPHGRLWLDEAALRRSLGG